MPHIRIHVCDQTATGVGIFSDGNQGRPYQSTSHGQRSALSFRPTRLAAGPLARALLAPVVFLWAALILSVSHKASE